MGLESEDGDEDGDAAALEALIAKTSAERSDLAVGDPITASFEVTAARGIRIDPDSRA